MVLIPNASIIRRRDGAVDLPIRNVHVDYPTRPEEAILASGQVERRTLKADLRMDIKHDDIIVFTTPADPIIYRVVGLRTRGSLLPRMECDLVGRRS